MDFVVCNQCSETNPALRSVCQKCGAGLADDLNPQASMPRATTRLASDEVTLGIVTFDKTARWLVKPQPVTSIKRIPDLTPGGCTNLSSALDLVRPRPGARVAISDLDVTTGRDWSECLMQIEEEHRRKIRWGVIGIREDGHSWNPDSRRAASHPHLYQESRYDKGLAQALVHISQTILEAHQTTELNVLLDTSGSMSEGNKWHAAKQALAALLYELQEDAEKPMTRLLARWQG